MPSITYWNQLQPSPRSPSVAEGLAALVRDPAWFLARQWQLGEFEGLDGGSPAFARIGSHVAGFESATLGSGSVPLGSGSTTLGSGLVPLAAGELLEPVVEAESITVDLATRVELGQTFETLVTPAIASLYRTAYPVAPADAAADPAEARFRSVCAGRVTDGVSLYQAAKAAQAAHRALPTEPALDAASTPAAAEAISTFIDWVESTWGILASGEPPAWDAARLDYAATVTAGGLTLSAEPDSDGAFDWYAFDLTAGTPPAGTPNMTSVLPGHVRFRGMPSPRWWDFESSATDFGALLTDTRDLAKLLFADFLLVHGDDWYLSRLDVPRGSLCWIDSLTVTDVFGTATVIPRADAAPGGSWTLFSTSDQNSGGIAPFLAVPASAGAALQASAPLEEVHLLRDETADMAWAVERIVEGPLGDPVASTPVPTPVAPASVPAALEYLLQSPLPANWFPLLPVVTASDGLALVAGTIAGSTQSPATRLLQQLSVAGFQLPQHEISRSGLRLDRVTCRTRTSDGNAKLWVARRRHIGAGEASSGLSYDEAIPAGQED
jgi:hypothetical protein